jgi:hypothetical protein
MTFTKVAQARRLCLTLVTLATQEAEIRRITVQGQPWANSSQDLNLGKKKKKHFTKKGCWE